MEIIASMILIGVCIWICKYPSIKAHNRLCPPGYTIDYQKMNLDSVNGMSQRDIDIKYNNGGYDVPADKYGCPIRNKK